MTLVIRKAVAADWPAVVGLCADTGRQGDPVGDEERAPFAEHWIGPYRDLRPDWTWVAQDGGAVIGYLTGCPDTMAFEKARRERKPQPDSREFFAPAVRVKLWTEHPAHAHMNVAAACRSRGAGAALLQAFFAELRRAGVPSAHIICGPKAAPYWARMAFRVEATVEAAPGVVLSAMTRPVV